MNLRALFISISLALALSFAQPVKPLLNWVPGRSSDSMGLEVTIAPGWHIVSNTPADSFLIKAEVTLEDSATIPGVIVTFPAPKERMNTTLGLKESWFEGRIEIGVRLPPADGRTPKFAKLSYQSCNDSICLPPDEVQIATPGAGSVSVAPTQIPAPAMGWLSVLLMAFFGGLLLNLMPCVLPVLSLKIFSLVEHSKKAGAKPWVAGIVYSLGVLVSFWILGGLLLALKVAGEFGGWGFQFQSPGFVVGITLICVVFALNLFGLFELTMPSSAQTAMDGAGRKSGLGGVFFGGVFMTLMSTPCSAPYLGPALGVAMGQTNIVFLGILSVVALGLASPYVLLSVFPQWLKFVPKRGMWMVYFKEAMGFVLLLTGVWLLSVLAELLGTSVAFRFLALLVVIGLSAWGIARFGGPMATVRKQWTMKILALVLIGAFTWLWVKPAWVAPQQGSQVSDGFSEAELRKLSESQDLFLDFGASWCLTCRVNEEGVLSTQTVKQIFLENQVTFRHIDYTKKDPTITAFLRAHGRAAVPFYLYIPKGAWDNAVVLPEVLTIDIVRQAVSGGSD